MIAAGAGADMREVLGGKGANLAEMCRLGIPVPAGFTLPTTCSKRFFTNGNRLDGSMEEAIEQGVQFVEEAVGASLGDAERPLLLSVRSGARDSMPGMMDTTFWLRAKSTNPINAIHSKTKSNEMSMLS